MSQFKNLLAKCMLAFLLLGGAAYAAATPTYFVSIDTSTLGTGPAYLGLSFMGLANAAPASATVSDLTGALVGVASVTGPVSGALPGPLVFGNANGGSDFVQAILLGELFSFNVHFDLGNGSAGTTFGWGLFNETGYLGALGDLGTIALQPELTGDGSFVLQNASAISNVIMVPEPSTVWLLMLAGSFLLLRARRR